jgi:integration host factor subunit alpha
MTLTKARLVNSIHKSAGFPKNRSAQLVRSLFQIIMDRLGNGDEIVISRFGKFCVKENHGLRRKNSRAKGQKFYGEGRCIAFKCSPVLQGKLNDERSGVP